MHGAGAALPLVTALLGAGQGKMVAKSVQQRRPGVQRQVVVAAVDVKREVDVWRGCGQGLTRSGPRGGGQRQDDRGSRGGGQETAPAWSSGLFDRIGHWRALRA